MPDEMLSLLESGNISAPIEPVAYDTSNIPELENSEILKIAEDVLDAAKYAYASVAANPEQKVRPDTLEGAFKESFDLMDDAKRESIREMAVQLTGFSEPARGEIFGRYGTMDSKSFLAQGFDRVDCYAPGQAWSPRLKSIYTTNGSSLATVLAAGVTTLRLAREQRLQYESKAAETK